MAVDSSSGLWATYSMEKASSSSETTVTRTPNSSLDKNAFLNLLVAQMKYQDPLNPMDDKEFLAQMAQFTSLEQMQNMNATTSQTQAYSMIGKTIVAETYNQETYTVNVVEGTVHAVRMKNGSPYLVVGDDYVEVPVSDVSEVYDAYPTSSQMQSIYNSLATSQNMALVGKYIQAITVDDEYNPTGFVEGKVDYVKFDKYNTILMVDGKEVFAGEVISVANEKLLIGKDVVVAKKNGETGEYDEADPATITDVKVEKDNSYLIINGKEVKIDYINYVTEALKLVGTDVTSGAVSGKVSSVVIKEGVTFVKVGTGEDSKLVAYSSIRGSTGSK